MVPELNALYNVQDTKIEMRSASGMPLNAITYTYQAF
jgi:hypothetical protein